LDIDFWISIYILLVSLVVVITVLVEGRQDDGVTNVKFLVDVRWVFCWD